jgi:hypothetical protein
MRAIADVTGPEIGLDGDTGYVAGLLLDVGASFLLWTLAERSPPAARGAGAEALVASTTEAVATFHAAYGQALLTRWGMPEDLAALVGGHHAATSPATESALWCAAVIAGPLAGRLAGGEDPTFTSRPRPELLDRCAHNLGLGETVLRRLAIALANDVREIWAVYA